LTASAANAARSPLPKWLPAWARELGGLYFSGSTCLFVLHGNVRDLFPAGESQPATFCSLSDLLATQLFGGWDVVLHYDVGHGLRANAAGDAERLAQMHSILVPRFGEPVTWPHDPERVLDLLDRLLERNMMDEAPRGQRKIALVIDYSQYLIPDGDVGSLAGAAAARLVRLLGWAEDPYLKRQNVAICLVADTLSEMNDRLLHSPHVATIEVPLPDGDQRTAFVRATWQGEPLADHSKKGPSLLPKQIADLASGLSLVNLRVLLAQAGADDRPLDAARFGQLKKSLIERQCGNLVEFIEPKRTLDDVVGHESAKARLATDAEYLRTGRRDVVPMGYLISGPVGTGKSFLAECYAGTVGVPCVRLRNFRSKYVGETEGNLQKVLGVLRSLGPVVVVVDEADAMLGNRSAEGDSGTSARVFSQIATQMGDTAYRGQIVWMLLTCRPDLLPIDLKRQGRAEVHIPLFYPQDFELRRVFEVMARKNGIKLGEGAVPEMLGRTELSGADAEGILLVARRKALATGRETVEEDDLTLALDRFLPSIEGQEKELQELAAVLECTDTQYLPPQWRERIDQPEGRTMLRQRLAELRREIQG